MVVTARSSVVAVAEVAWVVVRASVAVEEAAAAAWEDVRVIGGRCVAMRGIRRKRSHWAAGGESAVAVAVAMGCSNKAAQ